MTKKELKQLQLELYAEFSRKAEIDDSKTEKIKVSKRKKRKKSKKHGNRLLSSRSKVNKLKTIFKNKQRETYHSTEKDFFLERSLKIEESLLSTDYFRLFLHKNFNQDITDFILDHFPDWNKSLRYSIGYHFHYKNGSTIENERTGFREKRDIPKDYNFFKHNDQIFIEIQERFKKYSRNLYSADLYFVGITVEVMDANDLKDNKLQKLGEKNGRKKSIRRTKAKKNYGNQSRSIARKARKRISRR